MQTHTTYTCGEDGFVRAWRMPSDGNMDYVAEADESKPKPKDRKEKRKEKKDKRKGEEEGKKGRFAPY